MKCEAYYLGDVCTFIDYRGKTPPKTTKGIPLVTAKIVKNGMIQEPQEFITENYYDEWMRRGIPQKGSVLFTTEAPLGEVAQIKTDDKFAFAQRIIVLEPNTQLLNAGYLFYALQDRTLKSRIEARATGTTVIGIKASELKKVEIELPSLQQQTGIADILSSLDDKIELNNKINDNLFEMVNAYYTSLFKGGKCEMTSIGKYAERIYSGGTPATSNAAYWDGAFGWFSSGETRNRFVLSTEKTITQAGIDNSSTKLAAKYDIVMASAGQGFTRGQTSMLLIDTYVNQSVIVIHAERNVLPYLFWNLANRYEELRAISDSSSIRGSLTTKMIATFEIPRANKESLQAFADFSWSVIPQIENNLLENERLIALRDTLLPKLMSGEIDVSNIQL